MIIYGSRTLTSKDRAVTFYCPKCSNHREGWQMSMKRWFALYFIPIFPMYSQGEHVECGSCGGTYDLEILSYDPEAEQRETRANFRLLMVMGVAASGKRESQYLKAVQKAYFDLFEETIPVPNLEAEFRHAMDMRDSYRDVFQIKGRDLNAKGKQLLLQIVAQILSACGPISEGDKDIVRQIGRTYNLPNDYIESIFAAIVPNLYS